MRSDTKNGPPRRGRPRQYDPDAALEAALHRFWARGFTATSLDDLAAATGMNRPSLYAAFGDKEALYRRALARFAAGVRAEVAHALAAPRLADALAAFYRGALDVYCAADPPLGCFVLCTAAVEAPAHPEVRADLAAVIDEIDAVLARRFEAARRAGELPAEAEPRTLARLAQAVLHSLALRARAGASRASLARIAHSAASRLASSR